jgi:hypothetical protein
VAQLSAVANKSHLHIPDRLFDRRFIHASTGSLSIAGA